MKLTGSKERKPTVFERLRCRVQEAVYVGWNVAVHYKLHLYDISISNDIVNVFGKGKRNSYKGFKDSNFKFPQILYIKKVKMRYTLANKFGFSQKRLRLQVIITFYCNPFHYNLYSSGNLYVVQNVIALFS